MPRGVWLVGAGGPPSAPCARAGAAAERQARGGCPQPGQRGASTAGAGGESVQRNAPQPGASARRH